MSAFRLGTYIGGNTSLSQYVAKAIYDITEARTVLDTSCGWGDRTCRILCLRLPKNLYGCDPSQQINMMA